MFFRNNISYANKDIAHKIKTLYVSLMLLSLLSSVLYAQVTRPAVRLHELSGYVRDSLTGQPIANAAVRLNYDRLGLSTDSTGFFSINLRSGQYVVVISRLGYRPYRERLDLVGDKQYNIRLMNVAKELEEVIISTQTIDQNISRPLMGVSQLNIKTIKRLPAIMGEVDVLRSLQMLPGVTSVGEASNGVNVRGGTVDQNLTLLDDAPIFNPTHLFGLFSVFPPDAVNTMELYKGTTPARYGGRAASVLDISMINPSLDKFSMQGGISLVANRLTLETPIVKNKMGVLITGRGAFNDFLFKWGPEKLKNIRANFADAALKYFWQINDNNTFSFSTYYNRDFFQTDLLGGINNITSTSTQYAYQTLNFTGRWFHAINRRLNMQTVAVWSHYTPDILLPEANSDNKVTLSQSILQKQLKSNLNFTPNTQHKIEGGVSLTHYDIQPGNLNPGDNQRVNPKKIPNESGIEAAIHLEDEYAPNNRLTVSGGLRYSHFFAIGPAQVRSYTAGLPKEESTVEGASDYGNGKVTKSYGGFEPRFGLKYALNDQSSLKLGYNFMRQYIQVVSNTTTPLPTSRWKTTDTHIPPQMSQLLSVGYFRNLKSNIYEFSIEGYYRHTNNILDFKPGADFLLQPYIETQVLVGQSKAYGTELMITKKKGEWTGWINYTYARVFNRANEGPSFYERINNGNWYAANFDRPHTLNSSFSFIPNKFHTFSFTFVYSSGRPYTTPVGFILYQNRSYPFYPERNQSRIKSYHRLDFSWQINNPTLKDRRWIGTWNFTIYNLYGRLNQYSVFIRTKNLAFETFQLSIFGSPIVSLSYNFKFK
jgi:TonB dependent receptor/CarboxypepD_reg-like domain/TonB-dependent Receptor Plug Domain